MINNKNDTPEKFEPKDSKQKSISHPADDDEPVVKQEDKDYKGKNADFGNIAKKKENSEQEKR